MDSWSQDTNQGLNQGSNPILGPWMSPGRELGDLVIQKFEDDSEESREDESIFSTGDWMSGMEGRNIEEHFELATTTSTTTTESPSSEVGMSKDSLAFFLVYCSVFTLTILYIGVKLSKNWRKRRQLAQSLAESLAESLDPPSYSRCNHAICRQAAEANAHILPYSGIGAIWIPEMMNVEAGGRPVGVPGPFHNTGSCNNSCDNCRKLSLPPPSYTKLFLEENPPSYTDAVDMEATEEVIRAPEYTAEIVHMPANRLFPVPNNQEISENTLETVSEIGAEPVCGAEPVSGAEPVCGAEPVSGAEPVCSQTQS